MGYTDHTYYTDDELNYICNNCGERFGEHRNVDDSCPVMEDRHRAGWHDDSKFEMKEKYMIRCRFKTTYEDYRPAIWPIKHPYWCTGCGDGYWTIMAYADNEEEILTNWPEAYDLDSEEATEYTYTDRFQKPTWMD